MIYKGVVNNILNDAPFIGGLVIASGCSKSCKGCFNQALRDDKYNLEATAAEIVHQVKSNGLNEGIILSGLEWSEKPEDLKEVVIESLKQDLKVMVYTYHEEHDFFKQVPSLKNQPIYIKFGKYDVNQLHGNHESMGVKLASSNQYIKYFG